MKQLSAGYGRDRDLSRGLVTTKAKSPASEIDVYVRRETYTMLLVVTVVS